MTEWEEGQRAGTMPQLYPLLTKSPRVAIMTFDYDIIIIIIVKDKISLPWDSNLSSALVGLLATAGGTMRSAR